MDAVKQIYKAIDRKALAILKDMPAEEVKALVVRSLEEEEHLSSIFEILGVYQAVQQSVSEYCQSL